MSAAHNVAPRKQPRSESYEQVLNRGGYSAIPHEWTLILAWLFKDRGSERFLFDSILERESKRRKVLKEAGRDPDGWSLVFTLSDLAESSPWILRMLQRSFSNLQRDGVIDVLTRQEAIKQGIFERKEAGRPRDGAYTCRINREALAEIAERRRQEYEDAKAAAEEAEEEAIQEEAEADTRRARTVVRLTPKPIVHRPGMKAARVELDKDAQNALALVEKIEPRFSATNAIQICFTVRENVLQYAVADDPEAESQRANERRRPSALQYAPQNGHSPETPTANKRRTPSALQYAPNQVIDSNGDTDWCAERYGVFAGAIRAEFSQTTYPLIARIIETVRSLAAERALDPDRVITDQFLCWALERTSVFEGQKSAAPYLEVNRGRGALIDTADRALEQIAQGGKVNDADFPVGLKQQAGAKRNGNGNGHGRARFAEDPDAMREIDALIAQERAERMEARRGVRR